MFGPTNREIHRGALNLLKHRQLRIRECELCGKDTDVEQLDENGYCQECQAEIAAANAEYQSKPRRIDWGMIFGQGPHSSS